MSDDRKAQAAGEKIEAMIPTVIVDTKRRLAANEMLLEFEEDDFDQDIPEEYWDAMLLPDLKLELERSRTILLTGAPGTGKTHQAWAMIRANRRRRCRHLLGHHEVVNRPYDKSKESVREKWVRENLRSDEVKIISESNDILRHRYDRDWLDEISMFQDWLVIDDVGFSLRPNDWAIEAIYSLANTRRSLKLQTLWTSNLDPEQIKTVYSPAIASRLMGGAVLQMGGADRRLL